MLIEFSVTNFRSIKDKQSFNLIATSDKYLSDNIFPFDDEVNLLKTVAIYGGNATGKSNLLSAINFIETFVISSSNNKTAGEPIDGAIPFALSHNYEKAPSEFEIVFAIQGIRHQYGFSVTKDRVIEEYLFVYPNGEEQEWFYRTCEDVEQCIELSKFIDGNEEYINAIKQATRDNALFISTAAQLNHPQFIAIMQWFMDSIAVIPLYGLSKRYSTNLLKQEEKKRALLTLLKTADFSIVDIKSRLITEEELQEFPNELRKIIQPDVLDTFHAHNDNQKLIRFDFDEDESRGTRAFFALSGPVLDVLEKGKVLIVDEINSSLHPKLVKSIIKLFHDKKTNPFNAQLIFVTHDTTLFDMGILRDDQFWLVERDNLQATHVYPLSDYEIKEGESLQKGYLRGRYGGIPHINQLKYQTQDK